MPSRLRPSLCPTSDPAVRGGTALLCIYNAVKGRAGLIHGRLKDSNDGCCAIGCYFDLPSHMALPFDLIDEVAAVNDSLPNATPQQRRTMVLRWLRWKLKGLGLGLPGRTTKKGA